jgi:hypothetical protein
LENGAFYDPFGFYFNQEGRDEAGGYYHDDGYYTSPFDVEFKAEELYGDEDCDEDSDVEDDLVN